MNVGAQAPFGVTVAKTDHGGSTGFGSKNVEATQDNSTIGIFTGIAGYH